MTLRDQLIRASYSNPAIQQKVLPILTAQYVPEPRWYAYTNAPIFYYDVGFPDGHRVVTTYTARNLPAREKEIVLAVLAEMRRTRKHTAQETIDRVQEALDREGSEHPIRWDRTQVRRD